MQTEVTLCPPQGEPQLLTTNAVLYKPLEFWTCDPQPDITPLEAACLAVAMPSLALGSTKAFEWLRQKCGEAVMRHFRREGDSRDAG